MKKLMLLPAALVALAYVPGAVADEPDARVGCNDQIATIVGTPGDDSIAGTSGRDIIAGLGGDDDIDGGGGNDLICGGWGEDTIQGQGGTDRIFGEGGADWLDGGQGGCCPESPNTGNDVLWGGPGNDTLHTSDYPTEANRLFGEDGDDDLFLWSGGRGEGGDGADEIYQYTRDAVLVGGAGEDLLVDWNDGGFANETVRLLGGADNDILRSEDATSISHANGGGAFDSCTGVDTSENCES
jgi:Ca2+-binding RTX toxin-like protein